MVTIGNRLGQKVADIRAFIGRVYGDGLHVKRVNSLADATLGVMAGASLAVAMIGQALALAKGLITSARDQAGRPLAQQPRH